MQMTVSGNSLCGMLPQVYSLTGLSQPSPQGTHTHTDKRGPAILAVLTLMLDTDDHGREVGLLKGT